MYTLHRPVNQKGMGSRMTEEMWDAYDKDENKLGFEIPRSRAKSLPEGVFHVVIFVYCITRNGKVLTTRRSPLKTYPLKWEVTGGSIITGETPKEGAIRELFEETGIVCTGEELEQLYDLTDFDKQCIYHGFSLVIKEDEKIKLQDDETIDYKLLNFDEFKELVLSDDFVPSEKKRYLQFKDEIETKLNNLIIYDLK